jgi:hypothetical protein
MTFSDNYAPAVRYGFPADSDHARCSPQMYHVRDNIPADAVTVSPVYLLTEEECYWHDDLESPYAVSGSTNAAKKLQDACEREERVIYPIQAEADNYNSGKPVECIDDVTEFLEDRLGVSVASLYFSGRRSIHGHTRAYIRSEEAREWIKAEAEAYNEETSAELDSSIYNRKSMFRLPNVVHEKVPDTGIRKTEISREWPHTRIFQEAMENTAEPPETYHGQFERLTEELERPTAEGLHAGMGEDRPEWIYGHPFSPYGSASGGSRSVSFFRVEGAAYCLRGSDAYAFVPAFILGAVGCDGEFTIEQRPAPIKLSKRDYAKLKDAKAGETYSMVGGQSRSSRVFKLTDQIVHDGSTILLQNSRDAALEYLNSKNYDVGTSGAKGNRNSITRESGEPTDAKQLQRKAEREGFGTLTHNEKFRVACRLLHSGREYTHSWIAENMESYDYDTTENFVTPIYETYRDDYE